MRACIKIAQIALLIDSYLLNAYRLPGILINARDTTVNKSDMVPGPIGFVSCNREESGK